MTATESAPDDRVPASSTPDKQSSGDQSSGDWVARLTGEATREDAISELRDYLVRGLAAAMRSRYNGRLQADDVVQDAIIKIMASLDQFQGRSRFTTWAMTVAIRVSISEMRRRHYRDVSVESLTKTDQSPLQLAVDSAEPVENFLDRQTLLRKMQTLIDTELSDRQRIAIRCLLEGMPVETIAEKLGGNRNAMYKVIHDARVKLREGMIKQGIDAEQIASVFS